MVLVPSRQVHVVPLGVYLKSKDGWTPWVCGTAAVKTRVVAKERENSKECMTKKECSKLLRVKPSWAEFPVISLAGRALDVYGCLSITALTIRFGFPGLIHPPFPANVTS